MKKPEYDVLIIGAGAAGMAAAADLAAAGQHSALVLEARDRIGGRIWTRREPDFPAPIEMGAEFIHGKVASTFELLKKAGAVAVDTPDAHWGLRHGRLEPTEHELFKEIQQAMERAKVLKKPDISFAKFLSTAARYGLSTEARDYARMFVEGFDAADPERISAQAIAEEWQSGGMADSSQFRPSGGYTSLLEALVQRLAGSDVRLQLQTVVRAVRWRRGSVEVDGMFAGRPFSAKAKRAIVALPLGVLQSHSVTFTPALKEKQQALRGLSAGPVVKAMLRFRTPFWETVDRCRYEKASFFHAPGLEFPTFWTALPLRAPLMVAWAGGPQAASLSRRKPPEITRRAVACLQTVFAKHCDVSAQLEAAWCHNWQQDPFARGAYSYVNVGGETARAELAKPLRDTLLFAGEAADVEDEAGTVAGALQSGQRAAEELSSRR
jgi:monoamine oxidase